MILNKLKYKLEHKRESFSNEIEDKVTLTIIAQMAVKKKFVSVNSFKQLLFSLYWHIIVDMRANFWKAVNIILSVNYIIC
jgi:hypothetical protein